ncbi:DUF1870 family protein [Salmonella enterica]|nr:DUF1870 family protein [Salmonella enterica]EAO0118582.1 DUF1870 family protein [Salmonella enterica]EAO3601685.1 DUF1870 family protein [Salmonella enterica]EAR6391580.1 DUF1870 family protein [Salmonella enterica]EAV1285344.1 DUF1870 family protein [Salmonella enterica]
MRRITSYNDGTTEMNNLELIACRQLLFMDIPEAAELIGGVGQRTWRYYEAGRSPIPKALIEKMSGILECRELLLQRMMDEADEYRKQGNGRQVVPFFLTFEEYQQETGLDDPLSFRLDQSVKAALYFRNKVVFY